MQDRIQKVLSAQGIGSRREVERWIAEGRITVNGAPALPGQAIGPRDEVRLDRRRLRLKWDQPQRLAGIAYHRPALETLRPAAAGTVRSSIDRLPRPASGRWIPVCPMGLGEGGLELFVNDGHLAAALASRAGQLPAEFSVRVRGDFTEERIPDLMAAAGRDPELLGRIDAVEWSGGEAANRWAGVAGSGLRPRDLKRIFESCLLEANRILRTRLGPVVMGRALARGGSRKLSDDELSALYELAGLARPVARATAVTQRRSGSRPAPRQNTGRDRRGRPPRR